MNREVTRPWLLRPPVERSPRVRLFSGLASESSWNSSVVWKRRPADVGLNFFSGIGRASHAFEELDRLLAGGQPTVGLLPVLATADEAAHPLQFPLPVRHADLRDLDAEERRDRAGDLDLVGVAGDLEADRRGRFFQPGGLLGDQRPPNQLMRF